MDCPDSLVREYSLTLSDGSRWGIRAEDENAGVLVSRLGSIMKLKSGCDNAARLILVRTARQKNRHILGESAGENRTVWSILPAENPEMMTVQLLWLSMIVAKDVLSRGGLLLHAALAVREDGKAAVLAGAAGVGKSTSCRRLKAPWQALSDDCTLLIPGEKGTFKAHPWPTWSCFMFGGAGGSWDVGQSADIQALFFLTRREGDSTAPVPAEKAVYGLLRSAEEAWGPVRKRADRKDFLHMRLKEFDTICGLTKTVPVFRLQILENVQDSLERILAFL